MVFMLYLMGLRLRLRKQWRQFSFGERIPIQRERKLWI